MKERQEKSIVNRSFSDSLVLRHRKNMDHFDFDSALIVINEAIEKDEDNLGAWMQKGWSHFVRMEIGEALACFERSHSGVPDLYAICKKLEGKSPKNAQETAKILRLVHEQKWRAPLVVYAYAYFCQTTDSLTEQAILTREILRLRNELKGELNFSYNKHSLDLSKNPGLKNLDSIGWRKKICRE